MHPPAAMARAAAALVCAGLTVAVVVLYLWAVRTSDGQAADVRLFAVIQGLNSTFGPLATTLRPVLIVAPAFVCAVLGIVALVGRRWQPLTAAVLVVVVSVAGTQALKNVVLDRPYLGDHGYAANTFPSGHVSATLALLVAAALLRPPAWGWRRSTPGLLVLVAAAAAACAASLLGHTHRPSDVAASVLLVGAVTALVFAVLGAPRRPAQARPAPSPPGTG